MNNHYQKALQRLNRFLSDDTNYSVVESRAKLEAEGVDVDAILARMSKKLGASSSSGEKPTNVSLDEPSVLVEELKHLRSKIEKLDLQNKKIIGLIEKQGQHQRTLIWELVHQMTHQTRDLIVTSHKDKPQVPVLLSALTKFCNGIVKLLEDVSGIGSTFHVSVMVFNPDSKMSVIAHSEEIQTDAIPKRKKLKVPAFVTGSVVPRLLGSNNIVIRDNRIFVGIRKVRDDSSASVNLIGILSIEYLPTATDQIVFYHGKRITGDLQNMLLAYADIMFGIIALRRDIESQKPVSGSAQQTKTYRPPCIEGFWGKRGQLSN